MVSKNKFVAPILSCKICSWYKRKKGCFGFCRRLNEDLTMNYAPICKAYDYRQGVTVLGTIVSPLASKNVTKKVYAYNADDNIETVKYYENSELLFTLTYSYDANKNIEEIVRS